MGNILLALDKIWYLDKYAKFDSDVEVFSFGLNILFWPNLFQKDMFAWLRWNLVPKEVTVTYVDNLYYDLVN